MRMCLQLLAIGSLALGLSACADGGFVTDTYTSTSFDSSVAHYGPPAHRNWFWHRHHHRLPHVTVSNHDNSGNAHYGPPSNSSGNAHYGPPNSGGGAHYGAPHVSVG